MNCPRCNAQVAFTKNRCDNCGQNLKNYRRIVSLSNVYYNQGLSQAKVRDLSGAVYSLKQSLQFNKMNTSARNLLALIYYEEGEIVAALSEWVISKHFQDKDNEADRYIQAIQSNPNKLEMYNQTVKKYNSALFSAQHGDEDMAIIQLKKVVNLNPRFIRANQLLALLYMMTGKKDNRARAYKLMKNVSKIDVTNTTTLRYLRELSDVHVKADSSAVKKTEKRDTVTQKTLPRVDVDAYKTITPYKEEKPSILPFINVLIGVIVGLAIMYFLVIPHIRSNDANSANKNFKEYSEQQAANNSDVTTLKNQNKSLEEKVASLEKELAELQGGNPDELVTVQETYDNLLAAVNSYITKDMVGAAEKLAGVNSDSLTSDVAKDFYKTIKKKTYSTASVRYFENGRDAYNGEGDYAGKRDYDKSIQLLEKALVFDANNTDAIYFLGRCYQQKSEPEKAKEYYNKIVDDYPDSERVGEANSRLRELGE